MPSTHIINQSLREGVFPSELKLEKVVPIFKDSAANKITIYRPISVLPFFSKEFEKIIYNYFTEFMDHNDILYSYQFRQRHSIQQAIITLINRITSCLDVNHKIPLKMLYSCGIRGVVLKLLESYLSGGFQYVVYEYLQHSVLHMVFIRVQY